MKACIFDLDGTLADTLESLAYSVKASLREMGLPEISSDQCRQYVGNGARYLMERSLEAAGGNGINRLDEGMEVYGRIFDANCTYHVTPYKGIPLLLERLREKGVKLSVLSNKPHRQTEKVVREIFGEDVFQFVQGQRDGLKRKPDPEGVHVLIEQMQVSKDECLYIGDSEVDIKTAENAGVRSVIVTWGFREKEALVEAGAGDIIDTPDEILKYL